MNVSTTGIAKCKAPVVVYDRVPESNPLGVDVTQILVASDTRAFWSEVLGAEVYRECGSRIVLRFVSPGFSS